MLVYRKRQIISWTDKIQKKIASVHARRGMSWTTKETLYVMGMERTMGATREVR
jgi:hypothetical protein